VWPWVALASANMDEVLEAGRRIQREVPDPALRRQLFGEISVLGGLRYNQVEIVDLLGRFHMFLSEEILRESVTIQMAEERGIEAGKLNEARNLMRLLLNQRFPGLLASARIDEITDLAKLEDLAAGVFAASKESEARAAIAKIR
ncbi:MAG: hypothetical protein HYZ37_09605, partial [Candidatus Solibacter usitatus]|nr:hypothetical protein [Candidatus Solibacter usitatus]